MKNDLSDKNIMLILNCINTAQTKYREEHLRFLELSEDYDLDNYLDFEVHSEKVKLKLFEILKHMGKPDTVKAKTESKCLRCTLKGHLRRTYAV
jgi:hypothetical protein